MTSRSIDGPYVMQPVISCRMWVRPPIRSGPRLEVRLTSRVRFDSKGPSIFVRCRTMPPSRPMVGSVNHFLTLHPDGTFNGTVPLPEGSGTVNLTASLPRTGPITGANGSEDVSSVESVTLRLDEEPPIIRNLFVVQGTQRLPADGHTWDPASPLQLEVTIQDAQALGAEIVAHVWRGVR